MEITGWSAYGESVHTVQWYQIYLEIYFKRESPQLMKHNPKVVKVYGDVVIYTLDNTTEKLKFSRDLLKQEHFRNRSNT